MTNRKTGFAVLWTMAVPLILSGCGPVGSKAGSITWIYGAAVVLSLLLLAGYCLCIRRRDLWALLLFSSILVVNGGYFALSLSGTVEEALLANRISYLGAVFLPLSMLMIILNLTRLKHPRWLPMALLTVSIVIFLIAASPGYLDLYYKSVSLTHINGVAVLEKEYGPWHPIYLFYLLGYFSTMVAVVVHANVSKKLESKAQAAVLTFAVLVNIGVWLLEQLVRIDFELLSVSYIISEVFLLGLFMMMQESEYHPAPAPVSSAEPVSPLLQEEPEPVAAAESELAARCYRFEASLSQLTPAERAIYTLYAEGKATAQVLEAMHIKENTLKFHNKNIYSKLEVSSRKEMLELTRELHCLRTAQEHK